MRDLEIPDRVLIGGGQDKSGKKQLNLWLIYTPLGFLKKIF